MFLLESKVVFTKVNGGAEESSYVFNAVNEIEITKSVDELSDTAIIKLPTQFKIKQNGAQKFTEKALQVGDKVTITLGYEGKISKVEFVGYIKKISPKIPLEIHCEDAMWKLRRKNVSNSWDKKVTLEDILKEIVKDTGIELSYPVLGFDLEKWIINENGAQALEKLKQEFGFTSFINDEGKLHCGLKELTNIGEVASYDLNYNLVENNLEYKTKEDRKIMVKYTYIDPKTNERTIVEEGDKDGEQRTYTTSIASDKAQLKELVKAELEKLRFDGYNGDVTSFLIPYATRGMKAVLIDKEHTDREGSYFINKVVTTFGMSGARRKVSIRNRL
ncbi:late control protein [Flavobacterium sp. AJR]|uniref:late control protein n=1 Tax=Flavobacterium sp. AJR TaxID=1979369 RepID=UPI000B677460|nr:late control protein [Flavobacterium sp. AJR]OUL63101.1 late control protein [Flavobacterium sp. AJR]